MTTPSERAREVVEAIAEAIEERAIMDDVESLEAALPIARALEEAVPLLVAFAEWSEEHPETWEEHGEVEPSGHPRHIQCIAPADLAWLGAFEHRVRQALKRVEES